MGEAMKAQFCGNCGEKRSEGLNACPSCSKPYESKPGDAPGASAELQKIGQNVSEIGKSLYQLSSNAVQEGRRRHSEAREKQTPSRSRTSRAALLSIAATFTGLSRLVGVVVAIDAVVGFFVLKSLTGRGFWPIITSITPPFIFFLVGLIVMICLRAVAEHIYIMIDIEAGIQKNSDLQTSLLSQLEEGVRRNTELQEALLTRLQSIESRVPK